MGLTVPTLLQQVSVDTDDVSPTSSGVNQRFHRRGSILGPPKAVPCGRVRGHPHPEKFEIQVLGNPSPGVLRSRFFKPKCHSHYYFTISLTSAVPI